jgi:hypothetical protein
MIRSPPKPAGLEPQNFCRQTLNWMWNADRQKKNSTTYNAMLKFTKNLIHAVLTFRRLKGMKPLNFYGL